MKKTNKVKMGPLGTPLGNPLGYFNSLKGKKTEPKQTLRKAQDGFEMNGYGEDSNMLIDKPGYSSGYKKPVSPPLPPLPPISRYRNNFPFEGFEKRAPQNIKPPSVKEYEEEYDDGVKKYFENGQQSPGSNTNPEQKFLPPQSKGGSTNRMKKGGSHKMPNGKIMLNSAMKKGGLVKKKKC